VMPYEEGRSLRQRLQAEGALPMADALNVLRDVARALAYAHDLTGLGARLEGARLRAASR